MNGKPGPVQDLCPLDRVPPGAAHIPEAVVTIGVERVERQREPPCPGFSEARRDVLGDAHAIGADDDPELALGRAPDDLEDVAPQERLAAGQDRQAFRRERGDLVDHLEAFRGAELAAIGEVLGVHQGRAAGVEIAVLAGEIAAIGEVPGDDVGPRERPALSRVEGAVSGCGMFISIRSPHMPKKSRAWSRIVSSTSRDPFSRANFSMPVLAIGRTKEGMFASRASAADVHRTATGSRGSAAGTPGRPVSTCPACRRRVLLPSSYHPEGTFAAGRLAPRDRLLTARLGANPHAE